MKGGVFASIDVGTTKVCTVVGEVLPEQPLRILGVGIAAANGLSRGMVENLHDAAASIRRRIRAYGTILRADCLHGEVVRKEHIPRALREAYGLENLYVEDLPAFWRLLYTVVRDEGERYVVVIEIVDHPTYSRWFPGKRR